MYIIDRHRDFYDHYSAIHGEDKSIIFDRRNSIEITDEQIVLMAMNYRVKREKGHLLLETGEKQYLILVKDVMWNGSLLKSYSIELFHTYDNHHHLGTSPISLRWFYYNKFRYLSWNQIRKNKGKDVKVVPPFSEIMIAFRNSNSEESSDNLINLPILKDTKLTSLLDGETVWFDIQNYISSLKNDSSPSIRLSDVEKAEIHGFNAESFRHPIK